MSDTNNTRALLKSIGVPDFTATMIIQFMFIAPATTDPKSPPIMQLVKAIQRTLVGMGADLSVNGYLDAATATYLQAVVGPSWMTLTWSQVVKSLVAARDTGMDVSPQEETGGKVAVGDYDLLGFLPDVPGGLLTYGVAAYLIYRHFSKKRSA